VIQAAQERGEVRPIVPEMISGMLLAIVNWVVYFDSTQRFQVSGKIMMRQVIDVMLHGIVEQNN
jgi:hypothetical protein